MRSLVGSAVSDFRSCWKRLFLTDIIYKVTAFVLLTPLVALLFRILVTASGRAVLADQDILVYFLGPAGWFCLITAGGLWIGVVAWELAALMALVAPTGQQHVEVRDALRFACANAWPVLQVAARLVALTLLTIAPFLAAAAGVYFTLLGKHDINYYLQEKPPAFGAAVAIGVVIIVVLSAVLLRLFTSWFFALPVVLFEDVIPSRALQLSRQRVHGHRRTLLLWMLSWGAATFGASALSTTAVIAVGRLLIPLAAASLELLTAAIGASLLMWTGAGLAVNLLSTTSFAVMHFNLYRRLGSAGAVDYSRLKVSKAAGEGLGFRLTGSRLIAAMITGISLAAAVGVLAVRSVRLEDHVEIIAHRGSSNAAPENTMAAIKRAIEQGADWVEIDVQETADGHVVVFHDSDFMKLAGLDLKIWNATLDDLKTIDVGSWYGTEFQDERVPTLGEVLDECQGQVGVAIELKYYGHDQQLEQRVVDVVESRGMSDGIVIMSLKVDAVEKVKSLRPDWRAGLLMSVSAGNLWKLRADFLAVNAAFVSRRLVRTAHRHGKQIFAWTVNDPISMSTIVGRGVDGLITDKPALARSVLQQRARMSVPERLLVELADSFGVATEIREQ